MAFESCTLLVKGNLNISDAKLLMMLGLERPINEFTQYKITKENLTYHESISDSDNCVFVTSTDEFTCIVSSSLINDYAVTRSNIKNSIEKLFPNSEYFLFFSETVSMLNGFVYGKGDKIYRKKYVVNSKYLPVYDHIMDIGELLPEEKGIYINPNDYKNGFPVHNKEYMSGIQDLDISISFIERTFIKEKFVDFITKLIFNRNIFSEISHDYIANINRTLTTKDIESSIIETIKPLLKHYKFKKTQIKLKQTLKTIGYSKEFENGVTINLIVKGFNYRMSRLEIFLNHSSFNNMIDSKLGYNELFGRIIYSLNSQQVISDFHNGKVKIPDIRNWSELNQYLLFLNSDLDKIRSFINLVENNQHLLILQSKEYCDYCLNKIRNCMMQAKNKEYVENEFYLCMCYMKVTGDSNYKNELLKYLEYEPEKSMIPKQKERFDNIKMFIETEINN